MPGTPVFAGNTLTAGIRTEFVSNYARMYTGVATRLQDVMQLAVPSDKATEIYAYYESAPHAVRWPRGEKRSRKGFKAVQFSVVNHEWTVGVPYHKNDEQDDQTRSLVQRARDASLSAALISERVFFQILTAATDLSLLPAVPNAPDGSALFASSRFGVAGGNILTGTGVATAAAVIADFFNAIELFRQFQDTEGQPLFEDDIVEKGFVVYYNVANDEVFRAAFKAAFPLRIVQNVAANENVAAAAPSNTVLVEGGYKVELRPTQRITDNDWFVFAKGCPVKPIFEQARWPMSERLQTMDNSDEARQTGILAMDWDWRAGYGVNVPFGVVKLNN